MRAKSTVMRCGLAAALLLLSSGSASTVQNGLLQSKIGDFEYLVSIVRLELRDAGRDASVDLANGNRAIYCTGTYACLLPGLDENELPKDLSIHATATTGCVITGGEYEMAYREAEERYLRLYNSAKITASRRMGAHGEGPGSTTSADGRTEPVLGSVPSGSTP